MALVRGRLYTLRDSAEVLVMFVVIYEFNDISYE